MLKKLSILKRIRTAKRNNSRNKMYKTAVKNALKKCLVTVANCTDTSSPNVQVTLSHAYSIIDKAVQRGALHINNGARKKSRLANAVGNKRQELSLS